MQATPDVNRPSKSLQRKHEIPVALLKTLQEKVRETSWDKHQFFPQLLNRYGLADDQVGKIWSSLAISGLEVPIKTLKQSSKDENGWWTDGEVHVTPEDLVTGLLVERKGRVTLKVTIECCVRDSYAATERNWVCLSKDLSGFLDYSAQGLEKMVEQQGTLLESFRNMPRSALNIQVGEEFTEADLAETKKKIAERKQGEKEAIREIWNRLVDAHIKVYIEFMEAALWNPVRTVLDSGRPVQNIFTTEKRHFKIHQSGTALDSLLPSPPQPKAKNLDLPVDISVTARKVLERVRAAQEQLRVLEKEAEQFFQTPVFQVPGHDGLSDLRTPQVESMTKGSFRLSL